MAETVSVVILAKNEAARIARCLASVAWAFEVIVVDGMSEDGTPEIAARAGARVIRRPFSGSFAEERNAGMAAARGAWVLQLDADDVVTPGFRAALESALAGAGSYQAFKFRRKSYLLGHFMARGGWYHYLPNLVRRDVRYEGPVHERPMLTGRVGQLEADVEHHACNDLRTFVDRHNRYTSLSALELRAQRGLRPAGAICRELARRSWKVFWKTYVKKAGRREGLHGLVFSLFFAFVEALKWAKYWELCHVTDQGPAPAAPGPRGRGARGAQRLGVNLMTKNEAEQLAACLGSVAGWADEIVVIDDQSTDATREIAAAHGARVFTYASEGNHDRQWNRGLSHATADWVLHIDADERVGPALREAIDQALSAGGPWAAYDLIRCNHFLGRRMAHGGWRHRHRVLFRRARARCAGEGIHVKLEVDGPVGRLDAALDHFPFRSLSQFIERQNSYTSVEAHVLAGAGRRREGELRFQLLRRPVKLFWKCYVKHRAYRDGAHGFIFALLYSFMHVLLWAKYWEGAILRPAGGPQAALPEKGVSAWSDLPASRPQTTA